MGVTDLRPFSTRIIGHNSVNVHRIPTKVGTEIRLNEPFLSVPNFSPIGACVRVLWRILQSVRKEEVEVEEEKNEEKTLKLWQFVSRKRLEQVSLNLECRLPYLPGGHFCSKFGSNRIRDH